MIFVYLIFPVFYIHCTFYSLFDIKDSDLCNYIEALILSEVNKDIKYMMHSLKDDFQSLLHIVKSLFAFFVLFHVRYHKN